MIRLRTALVLYALLVAVACAVLKGPFLKFTLILIAALASKSALAVYKSRL